MRKDENSKLTHSTCHIQKQHRELFISYDIGHKAAAIVATRCDLICVILLI